jgi:HK97 family phage portal protein
LGLLTSLFERRAVAASAGNPRNPSYWLTRWAEGEPTWTGRRLTTEDALRLIPVYACVRVLAETIGTLPLPVYRRTAGDGRERVPGHPLYRILHDAPNPEMTSVSFREAMVGHLALWGNCYAEIETDAFSGEVKALWPLRSDKMRVVRTERGLGYSYTLPNGQEKGLVPELILHVPLFSPDGITGYSPIGMARQAAALGLAAEEYGARFFGNDARPGGYLKHPGHLSLEAQGRLKADWEDAHRGLSNAQRIAILEEGMDFTSVGMPLEDMQFIELRKFQAVEIARLYRIPPHLIQELGAATFTNIEHQGLDFVVHTIRPYAVRFEQAFRQRLFRDAERDDVFAEFVLDGLVRGDLQARWAAYGQARNLGVMSANDIRRLENQNPLPPEIGDVYWAPQAMIPAELLGKQDSAQPDDAPPDEGDDDDASDTNDTNDARSIERRGAGSAASRLKLGRRYRRLFVDAATRITRRDVRDVSEAAEKLLGTRDAASMAAWIDEYYATTGPDSIRGLMLSPLLTYADVIHADALAELGEDADELPPEMERFVRDYLDDFALGQAGRSAGQLKQVVREAVEQGRDPKASLRERLAEWAAKRPAKIADVEATRAGNAVVRETWKRRGVRRIQWVAQGGRTCPYCRKLDGKTVGIEQMFLGEGEEFKPDGADAPLRPSSNVRHPPAHSTCVCGVKPG